LTPLYERDGNRFVPTPLATGPWDAAAQHGGAPAALLSHHVEGVDAPAPMNLVRATFELLRPVPLRPLDIRTEVVREGKRVQLVSASLHADEVEVMRATCLRIRDAHLGLADDLVADDPPPVGPEHGVVTEFIGTPVADVAFHTHANEILFVEGGFDRPGPATAWIRLNVPVVDDEPVSPIVRLAAAADFGNGLSWVLPRLEWTFVNPDLTVHCHRPPQGEWIGLRSRTFPGEQGSATAESELYDERGRVGRAVQSLYLDRR
jgi:hypothetical protein